MRLPLIFLYITTIFTFSCKDKDRDPDYDSFKISELIGSWQMWLPKYDSELRKIPFQDAETINQILHFSESEIALEIKVHKTSANENIIYQEFLTAEYELGATLKQKTREITLKTAPRFSGTVRDSVAMETLNSASYCGVSTWQVQKSVHEVEGKCMQFYPRSFHAISISVQNINDGPQEPAFSFVNGDTYFLNSYRKIK